MQYFPKGAKRTGSKNYDSVLSAFPTFVVQNYDQVDLGFLSFGGMCSIIQILYNLKIQNNNSFEKE